MKRPLIVGLGGSTRPGSSTEKAVNYALDYAASRGARTRMLGAEMLSDISMYCTGGDRTAAEVELVEAVRSADGLIIGTPGYHGSISGLIKNALDLIEDTAKDARPYFTDRAVGCVVTAYGWQAAGTTLVALRSIVHALRGWPTPMGAALNLLDGAFDDVGIPVQASAAAQIRLVTDQVLHLARLMASEMPIASNA